MKRTGVRPQQRQAKPAPAKGGDTTTVELLPMEIQIGDRFIDHDFEGEVVTQPAALNGGKCLRVRIRRPGLPETGQVVVQGLERIPRNPLKAIVGEVTR